MDNESDFRAYIKALFEAPITILFVILDIIGAITFFIWVVDDWGEGLVVLCFILILHIGHYYVFKKQRNAISELSKKIDLLIDVSPKLSFQFLENNEARSRLAISVSPVPQEPNYDDLVALEEEKLDKLYEAGESADAVSKLAMSAMLAAGAGRKSHKIYKDECTEYLKEFRSYLQKDFYFRVKENRLRSIKFQIDNFEGKTLAQDIVIVTRFPEELHPVQNDQYVDLILFNDEPEPPEKPNVTNGFYSNIRHYPFIDMVSTPANVDATPKSVRGPFIDNGQVNFEVDKLLHKFSEEFDEVFLLVRDEHVQRVWEIEYSIHAAQLPNPKTGTLLLEIRMQES